LFDHKFVFNLKTFHSSHGLKTPGASTLLSNLLREIYFCLNIAITVGHLYSELALKFKVMSAK